jgi:hypothetical protein
LHVSLLEVGGKGVIARSDYAAAAALDVSFAVRDVAHAGAHPPARPLRNQEV